MDTSKNWRSGDLQGVLGSGMRHFNRAQVAPSSGEPNARCALCVHALQVSAFTETVECSKTEKLKNADLLRCCSFFEPA
jgi:uncharacterized protein (UPF0548 family)